MKINNLSVSYDDKKVLENFDIEFEKDKITVLMGASGVGKTTLLNCIARLVEYRGEIEEGKVSYMFQEPRLIEPLTVYDNLLFVLGGKNTRENAEKIKEIIKKVELEGEEQSFIYELSGGMQSRVALARAFLVEGEVLLMDEPMRSLDISLRLRLADTLKKLLKDSPKTTVLVTHDVDEALGLADRIVVLSGTPARIKSDFIVASYEQTALRQELLKSLE